jgi:hypothetical protein
MSISVINDFALVPPGNRGEAVFTTPGTYSWTCPTGVTNICAVCIGGGGGGESVLQLPGTDTWTGGGGGWGGGLAWSNSIPVTPGATYKIQVGAGGAWGNYLDRTGNVIPAKMGGASIIYSPADNNANTPFYPTQITGDNISYSNLFFDITTSPGNRLLGNVVVSTMVRSTVFSSNTRTQYDAHVVAMGSPGADLAGNILVRVYPVIKNYNNQAFYFTANALLGAGGGCTGYPGSYYRGDYPFYSLYGTRLTQGNSGGAGRDGATQILRVPDGGTKTVVWLQGGGGASGRYYAGGGGGQNGSDGSRGGGANYWYDYTYSAGAGGGGGCFDTTADPGDTTYPVPMAGGGGGTSLYNLENISLGNLPAGGVGCGTSAGYYYSAKGDGGEGSPPGNYPQPGGVGTNYPRICRDGTNTTRTGGDYGGGGAGGVGTWDRTGYAQGGGNGGGGAVRIIWGAGRSILDPTP